MMAMMMMNICGVGGGEEKFVIRLKILSWSAKVKEKKEMKWMIWLALMLMMMRVQDPNWGSES